MVDLLKLRRLRCGSAERERESLQSRIEKLDFELPIGDRLLLPDQLVQPLFGHRAVALFVDVNAVSRAWLSSIDQNAKFFMTLPRRTTRYEMKIPRGKTASP